VTCILVHKHKATSQEGVNNFHLCLSVSSKMKARSPDKSMNVSDVKVTVEDVYLSSLHDDQSKEHHHEGANLDQSCRSARSCFSICIQTLYRCTMSVSLQFERNPVCTLNRTSEMSQMERSRCILNVERFIVEKCPMRYESIGRHTRATMTQMFGRIDNSDRERVGRFIWIDFLCRCSDSLSDHVVECSLCRCNSRLQQSAHGVICLCVLSQS